MPIGKKKSGARSATTTPGSKPGIAVPVSGPPLRPNRNTIGVRPQGPAPTKSELYEMLRKAVENTR